MFINNYVNSSFWVLLTDMKVVSQMIYLGEKRACRNSFLSDFSTSVKLGLKAISIILQHILSHYLLLLNVISFPLLQPEFELSAVVVLRRKRFAVTTTLNHDKAWPHTVRVLCEALFLYQVMFFSMVMTACRMRFIFQQ